MSGFRYHQISRKSKWKWVADSGQNIELLKKQGIKFLTILAVSDVATESEPIDPLKLKYRGPLYFDIDFAESEIDQAITSVNLLLNKLQDFGVVLKEIDVFASGKKGFHVTVPNRIFSNNRLLLNLNTIYNTMAAEMHVPGMDYNVYSGGKGVCWRLPNIPREDNGMCRVLLTIEEVRAMTPERYKEIIKYPREEETWEPTHPTHSPQLETLFQVAKKQASTKSTFTPIPEEFMMAFKDAPPPCIIQMLAYEELSNEANFNLVTLQFCVFAKSAGVEQDQIEAWAEEMSENAHSTQYNNTYLRKQHILQKMPYVNNSKYEFSCSAIQKLTGTEVCEDCGLKQVAEETDADVCIITKPDGYYAESGGDRLERLTTFTLEIESDIYSHSTADGEQLREGMKVIAITKKGKRHKLTLLEDSWVSKNAFVKALMGRGDLACFAQDHHIQRLKYHIDNERPETMKLKTVYAVGIQREETEDGEDRLFYVERGYVPDKDGEDSAIPQYEVSGRIPTPPRFKKVPIMATGSSLHQNYLKNLLQTNLPYDVGLIGGWYAACFLKQHLKCLGQQFPLLNLWGGAGSGKTSTATLWAKLHGVDMLKNDQALSIPGITPWALYEYMSTTTTACRVLDEVNKSKIDKRLYNVVIEAFKSTWGEASVARGTTGSNVITQQYGRSRTGSSVIDTPMCSPIVFCSEQMNEIPAVQERAVVVNLEPRSLTKIRKERFTAAVHKDNLHLLAEIGKMMLLLALDLPPDTVSKMYASAHQEITTLMVPRKQQGLATAIMGLDFMAAAMQQFEVDVQDDIQWVKKETLAYINDKSQTSSDSTSARTEIDLFMDDVCMMASIRGDNGFKYIKPTTHYAVEGSKLTIDVGAVYAQYRLYRHNIGASNVALDSYRSLYPLLKQESYFISDTVVDGSVGAGKRRTAVLDMDIMRSRDIQVDLLEN